MSNVWVAPAEDLSRASQITFGAYGRRDGWANMDWTPEGKAVSYRDAADGIWKQSLDSTGPKRLEGLPQERLYSYSWSPDGKQFAFTRGSTIRDVVLIKSFK
jgi:Tol biopolymer transport system component